MIWCLISGAIHIIWEGSWSIVAPRLTQDQGGWWRFWTLYGRADARYLHADPFIRVLELFTGTVVGVLQLWCGLQFWRRRNLGAATITLLIVSIMELYGTVMYVGSEMLNHWANLDTTSFVHTWIMFVGLNLPWAIFPTWCVYQILTQQRQGPGWRASTSSPATP
jgi:cholestenol delta-isomerase